MKNLLSAAILIGSIGVANANLVQNGSFEADTQKASSWSTYGGLSKAPGHVNGTFSGWTAGENGIELRNNIAGVAKDGHNFVELDTYKNSSMSQDISTALNQAYTLSFWYANRSDVNFITNANTQGLSWSFGNSHGDTPVATDKNWHLFTTTVYGGIGSTTPLMFSAMGKSDSYGSSLDNISVSPVPEPEEWAMMLLGLGLMGFVSKRKNLNNVIAL
jgi:hypothetical protein